MKGFIHGSGVIFREKGIRGFFQGFVPTTARQAANSAVRFSSYTSLKQLAQSYVAPGEKLGSVSTFALGAAAGTITVYTTMPLDTVKTRMQSLEARKEYRNSFNCAARIFREEGILAFWSGALPRLGRLMLSGGIVFAMYVMLVAFGWRWVCGLGANDLQVREDDGYTGQHRSGEEIHLILFEDKLAIVGLQQKTKTNITRAY
jgi:solute carrier family 25 citrate transporter 1